MAKNSTIQWTDATWNIARGCTKVDADCKFCYMYRDSMNGTRYDPINVIKTKTVFNFPLKYKAEHSECWHGRPLIFTSSLTDFFHPEIDSYREEAWAIIKKCPHLIFQILTKRPERIAECLPGDWGGGYENVWLGTSVGSGDSINRITQLVNSSMATVKFLSLEPLHSEIDLKKALFHFRGQDFNSMAGIDWVIVGGESGNENGKYRYRPCEMKWIENIVSYCKFNQIPVFVKQLGTHLSKELKMKDRHGGDISEFPEHLKIREFPNHRN